MTDEPDETTLPDAASDAAGESGSGDAQAAASQLVEQDANEGDEGSHPVRGAVAPAAVARAPRPGQRVPRRATAPSPRTAPAVVVAPAPPRTKSAAVIAPPSPPATAPVGDDGDGDSAITASTPSRPPRVRRRTRAQRPAGSAGPDPVPEAARAAVADRAPGPGSSSSEPVAAETTEVADVPEDGLAALRGLLAQADDDAAIRPDRSSGGIAGAAEHPDAESGAPGPRRAPASDDDAATDADQVDVAPDDDRRADLATVADADAAPDPAPRTGIEAARDADAQLDPDPDAQPDADADADADTEDAGPDAEPEPEPASDSTPEGGSAPARAMTVRTDSLTAPRPTRPDLPGVRETALTPSVRGDRAAAPELGEDVLVVRGLTKRFDEKVAVDDIALTVRAGSFYGIVGPNGAGKTTTMSMVTGLLRPDGGTVTVNGIDVWRDPLAAKRSIGVLPDRLRLFDRLTGAQLLHYAGALRGLDDAEIRSRAADLVAAFGLEDAVGRLVTDYSAGMAKKVALACAMIHSPRMLVLDEPFESVDPVSAANVVEILQDYVAHGGTVVLSSHGMDFIQRICDHVAIIVNGRVLAAGTMDEVRAGRSLEERFVALAGGRRTAEGFSWLHSFSD